MEYEDLVRLVFESETGRTASIGAISEAEHWQIVARKLKYPGAADALRDEFFAGDVVDRSLVDFIRSLRPRWKTGLISNAWNGLRAYLAEKKFDDAFDGIVISAEAGVVKPGAEIYQMALDGLGVHADEAVFVDDIIENVEGARALGMTGIHFQNSEQAIGDVKRYLKIG